MSLREITKKNPASHPVPFFLQHTNYELPPPSHIQDWFARVWESVYADGLTNVALFAPRGYSKTVSTIEVIPAWFAVNFPEIKIAITSHKKGHASKRAKSAVNAIERAARQYDINISSKSKTTIQLGPGENNIEPTLEPQTIRTDDEGSHYDLIIYDDIATWGNQTTAHKKKIRRNFKDWMENKAESRMASCLPNGSVNILFGTRKTPTDLYQQEILKDDYEWDAFVAPHAGNDKWNACCWRVTPDWHVVEEERYVVTGSDGNAYDTVRDVPRDIQVQTVEPTDEFRVLWPEFDPVGDVLKHLVTSEGLRVWRTENQQNPDAQRGAVLKQDWLREVDGLQDYDEYQWYAGLDFANPDNMSPEDRSDSADYWSLSVGAHDPKNDVTFWVDMWRDKDLTWTDAANQFVEPNLQGYPVGEVLIESNFDGNEIADTIDDETDLNVTKSNSQGDKESRIISMSNKFQQGKVKIAADITKEKWQSFIRDEWLEFPNSEHDDRLDATEIMLRGPDESLTGVSEDDFDNISFS